MKLTLPAILFTGAMMLAFTAAAFGPAMPPRHGDHVNYRVSDTFLSPDTTSAGVWDFSSVSPSATGIEFSYSRRGDSLFSERRPGIRRDYLLRGDSLMHVRTETHNWRVDLNGDGAPYAMNPVAETPVMTAIRETGRQYLKDSLRGSGEATLRLVASGRLILPDDVEIDGVNLYGRTITTTRHCPDHLDGAVPPDSLQWDHTELVYTWEHPSLRYPLAETLPTTSVRAASSRPSASSTTPTSSRRNSTVSTHPPTAPLTLSATSTRPEWRLRQVIKRNGTDKRTLLVIKKIA